jgi:hypothetical protein
MLHRIYLTKARNLGFYAGWNGFRPMFSRYRYLLLSDSEVQSVLRQLTYLGHDVTAIAERKPPPDEDLARELDKVPPDE